MICGGSDSQELIVLPRDRLGSGASSQGGISLQHNGKRVRRSDREAADRLDGAGHLQVDGAGKQSLGRSDGCHADRGYAGARRAPNHRTPAPPPRARQSARPARRRAPPACASPARSGRSRAEQGQAEEREELGAQRHGSSSDGSGRLPPIVVGRYRADTLHTITGLPPVPHPCRTSRSALSKDLPAGAVAPARPPL
jgi:hypothetical protein